MTSILSIKYHHDPSDYTILTNPCSKIPASCIIVDYSPEIFNPLLEELVGDGRWRLVMSAPFANHTISLLNGNVITIPSAIEQDGISLPDLNRCVLILNLHNGETEKSPQSFYGDDNTSFLNAGYAFICNLRGFLGQVIFTTRKSISSLRSSGVYCPHGVVSIDMDENGKMGTYSAIRSLLDQCLIRFDTSSRYRIVVDSHITFEFGGDNIRFPRLNCVSAFVELIKSKGNKITHDELQQKIDAPGDRKKRLNKIDIDRLSILILRKLIDCIKANGIEGIKYGDMCKHLKYDPDACADISAMMAIVDIKNYILSTDKDIRLEHISEAIEIFAVKSAYKYEHTTDDRLGYKDEAELGASHVEKDEKAILREHYFCITYGDIPTLMLECAKYEKTRAEVKIEGCQKILACKKQDDIKKDSYIQITADERRMAISIRKDMNIRLRECDEEIKRTKAELKTKRKMQRKCFREGIIYRKKGNWIPEDIYSNSDFDNGRKQHKTMLGVLERCKTEVPKAFADYIVRCWNYTNKYNQYIGEEEWEIIYRDEIG